MDMNRKGQTVIVGAMLALMVVWLAVIMIYPVKEATTTARDASHLNCTDPNLSVPIQLTCVAVDFQFFAFIAFIFLAAAGFIFWKGRQGAVLPPNI